MKDLSKTKQALIEELASLRRRIGELEQSESERRKAEKALRESEGRLNTLYQESPIPTFTWQKRGNGFFLVDFNRAAVGISDGKAKNFLGKRAAELYQYDPQVLEDMRRCFTEHSVIRRDLLSKHFAPGKSLSVHFAFIPPDLIIVHAEDQTERKRAEENLRESEEKYRSLFDNSIDAILLTAPDGRILAANPKACQIFGRTEEEICRIGREGLVDLTDPRLAAALEERMRIGQFRCELTYVRKNGTSFPGEVSSTIFRDRDGNSKTSMIIRDITEHKRIETELRDSEERYRRIVEASSDAVLFRSEDNIVIYANPAALKLFRANHPGDLNGKQYLDLVHPDDRAISAERVKKTLDEKWIASPREHRMLALDGQVVRVESTGMPVQYRGKAHIFGIFRDITERKRAEAQLRRQTDAMEAAIDGMALLNEEGKYVYLNKAHAKIYGYKNAGELIGKSWKFLYDSDELQRFEKEIMPELGRKGDWRGEAIGTKKDGSKFPQELSLTAMADGGLICVVRDITERKRAEATLRESEKKYRELYDFLPIPVYEMDFEANITSANRAIYETFGGTKEDLKRGFNVRQLLSPEEIEKSGKNIEHLLKGEQIGGTEYILMRLDGSVFPAIVISSVIYSNGKPVGLKGAIIDITQRKQAEESLKESEKKYRLLADNINDVIFVLDMNLNFTYASPSIKILMGYEPKELLGQPAIEAMTPSSWDLATKTISEVIELNKFEHSEIPTSRTVQLELRRKDGTTVWAEVKASFIRDENQQMVGLLGVTRDITERKRVEKQIQDTLESLRKAVGTTIQAMVSAVEIRDPYTSGHQVRSADLARAIATEMGLPQEKIDGIRMAGSIHDIGKLSIPAEILSKPTKLSEIEFALIKEHAQQGFEILKGVESSWPLAEMVYQHHERMDGSGYPRHLKGEEILTEARILAVADVVEAMASHRPYRPALGLNAGLKEIENNKGTLYDADVVDACLRLFREKGFKLGGA